MKYPHPCDSCHRKDVCYDFRGCAKYLKRFRTIWAHFNGYPARVYKKIMSMKREKFIYEHPDVTRKYIQKGPCAKCPRAEDCEVPCVSYWIWWDIRMEWMRRKLNGW